MTETDMKWALVAGLVVVLATGCGKKEEAATTETVTPAEPPPLARVGDRVITEDDFNREVERRIASGRPVQDTTDLLDEMIERATLLHQAGEAGAENDPEIQRALENQLLSHWLEQTLQQEKNAVSVTDEELRAAYEADLAAYTRPAMMRVALLYRQAPPTLREEERAAIREELVAAREEFLRDPAAATQNGRISGFGALAAQASEDAVSRYRGGDIGWHQTGRDAYRWPVDIMETAFALPPGQPSDVMAADDGFFVVMKSGEQAELVTPFEEAKVLMRRRMIREKQQEVEASFRERIKQGVAIEVNEARARELALPATPAPVPPEFSRSRSTLPEPEISQP